MHECPRCFQACDCIGDDTWCDAESEYREHDCEWDEEAVAPWDDGFHDGFIDHEEGTEP